jgi:biopolymer transport protein ExbB/TolQ
MSTIVRFFQDGGAFMYPILFVFAVGVAIAIERWMYLTMSGASNRALWQKIVPFLKAGNFQEAAAHTSKSKAANVATLLGLLGTIIGLINAFTAVSNANPADKADMLSASISVAMNTTAFGLMAAIPLLLVHALLQTKTNGLVDSLEMASVKFLNAVTERQLNPAGA